MQFTLINGHGPPPVLLGDSLAGNKRLEWDGLLPVGWGAPHIVWRVNNSWMRCMQHPSPLCFPLP